MLPNWIYYILGKKSGGEPTPTKTVVPNGMKFSKSAALPDDFNTWDLSDLKDGESLFEASNFESFENNSLTNLETINRGFYGNTGLKTVKINSANITTFADCFYNCPNLINIEILDTSKVKNFSSCFNYCSNLETIENLDTSSNERFQAMFANCTKLKNIPILQLNYNSSSRYGNMFYGCNSLTNQSLDNILVSCINSSLTSNKKLTTLSVSSVYNEIIPTLPHYQDFINARLDNKLIERR